MSNLFMRLNADTGGAVRQLERVGYTLERLARVAETSGAEMRRTWEEDRSAAGRLANAIQSDAEKQILAWKTYEEAVNRYVAEEGAKYAELVALHDEAMARMSSNPGLAKIHATRISQLEEEKAGVIGLAGVEGGAAMEAIALSQRKQEAIGQNADKNIAKIHEQSAAQEEADRKQQEASREFRQGVSSSSMSMMMGGAVVLGVVGVITAGLYEATRAATHFDSDLILLRTHAGATKDEVEQFRSGILALGPAVGLGPDELVKGFYHIQSAGSSLPPMLQTVAGKMEILTQTAHLAKVGHADLEQTTNAMVSVLDAYKDKNLTAAQAAGILNTTVGEGNMRMADLNSALKSGLLPVAEEAGVSLASLGAGLATLTDLGIPASRSATYLRSAIIQMTMPSGPAAKALEAIGLGATAAKKQTDAFSEVLLKAGVNQTAVAQELQKTGSLTSVIGTLREKLMAVGLDGPKAAALLERAFGGIRSGTGIVGLANNFEALKAKENDAINGAKDFDDVWKIFNENDPDQAVARMHAGFQTLEVTLGKIFMPTFLRVVKVGADFVGQLTKWVTQNQSLVASIVPIVLIGGALIGTLLLAAGGLGFLIIGLTAVGGSFAIVAGLMAGAVIVIGLVAAAVVVMHSHWREIVGYFNTNVAPILREIHRLWGVLLPVLETVATTLLTNLGPAITQLGHWLTDTHGPLTDLKKGAQDALKAFETWMRSREFSDIMAAIGIYLPKAIGVAVIALETLVDVARLAMNTLYTVVKAGMEANQGKFKEAGATIAAGWKTDSDLITQISKDQQAGMKAVTDLTSSQTQEAYDRMSTNIRQGVQSALDPVPQITRTKMDAVTAEIEKTQDPAKTKGHAVGAAAADAVAKGIDDNAGKSSSALELATRNAASAGERAAAGATMVGAALADGIAEGIRAHQGAVNAAAAAAVSGALGAAKDAGNVQSPSKVFRNEVGLMLAAGTEEGLYAGGPGINAAAQYIINEAARNARMLALKNAGAGATPYQLDGEGPGASGRLNDPTHSGWGSTGKEPIDMAQLDELKKINANLMEIRKGNGGGSGFGSSDSSLGDTNSDTTLYDALHESAYLAAHYGN